MNITDIIFYIITILFILYALPSSNNSLNITNASQSALISTSKGLQSQTAFVTNPVGDSIPLYENGLIQIAIDLSGTIWGINAAGDIYNKSSNSQTWVSIPGNLLSVAINGNIWGVDANNTYIYANNNWSSTTSSVKIISIAGDPHNGMLLGLTADKKLYYRNGITTRNITGTDWTQIDSNIMEVTIDIHGNIYMINPTGLYQRIGISTASGIGTGWSLLMTSPTSSTIGNLYNSIPSPISSNLAYNVVSSLYGVGLGLIVL